MTYDLKALCENDGGQYKVNSLSESYDFCKKLALGHYENFPVASVLLPKDKRKYVFSVYAFARIADDIADEDQIPQEQKLTLLSKFKTMLYPCNTVTNDELVNYCNHPIFASLHDTINELKIPKYTLEKLLIAFSKDSEFKQAVSWADTLDYCVYSANPVGELVLRVFEEYNKEKAYYSDKICTGLQLANFWQDLSVDIPRGRHYIPKEIFEKHKINQDNLLIQKNSIIFSSVLDEVNCFTIELFEEGKKLINLLKSRRLRLEISITVNGGIRILEKVMKNKENILLNRPNLSKLDILSVFFKSIASIF